MNSHSHTQFLSKYHLARKPHSSKLGLTVTALTLGWMITSGYAAQGDSLWKFNADFGVTVVVPIDDLSGNGGMDVLVGSQDDSLYLVEGKGPNAGNQLWSRHFKSTLSASAPIPDINGDGKPDVVAGDQFGLIGCYSGATGDTLWLDITFGTILSLTAVPDVNGDNIPDIAAGSENDTVYMYSGKQSSRLGKSLWKFGIPALMNHPGSPAAGKSPAKSAAGGKPVATPMGANSLAVLYQKTGGAFGLVVGTSSDTVYCLAIANGAVKWKTGLPGDAWKVLAFPDQDGDGIDEVLLACGADEGMLLSGATGGILWTHNVTFGATSIGIITDMNGDGKSDALIGDGNGAVHCVSGAAKGLNVKSEWTFSFRDTSTILSVASMGDLDKDGKGDCVVGTSSDLVAIINGNGAKTWSVNLGGEVPEVVSLGDLNNDGLQDLVAGTSMGFAQAFSGGGSGTSIFKLGAKQNITNMSMPTITLGRTSNGAFGIGFIPPGKHLSKWFDSRGRVKTLVTPPSPKILNPSRTK